MPTITAKSCITCLIRQAVEAVEMATVAGPQRERLLRRLLHEIADADWSVMPVVIAQRIQRLVRAETGVEDPYRELKDRMNHVARELLPAALADAQRQPDTVTPHEAVVRLAIAGNLLDAGAKTRTGPEELAARLATVWDMPLVGSVNALFAAADRAQRILYLADNAGEIVFDRLLVQTLPAGRVTVAVRGVPVINDATLDDAEAAGLATLAPIITNGSDAPGTLLSECSQEFRDAFARADLIVAKGQGNYETLADTSRPVFFLLAVKCPIIAAAVGAPVGALVIRSSGDTTRT